MKPTMTKAELQANNKELKVMLFDANSQLSSANAQIYEHQKVIAFHWEAERDDLGGKAREVRASRRIKMSAAQKS